MNYQKNKSIKALALASFMAVFFLLILSVNQVQATNSEIILQPASGLNNGTDEGTASGGKDTYVSFTRYGDSDDFLGSGVNFGTKEELVFDYYSDYDGYPLLKFDVSDLPASDVVSAKLYLYVTANCGGGSCPNMDWNVNAITSSWDEMSTTWNARPPLGSSSYGTLNIPPSPSAVHESGHDHWVSVNITDLYNGWKSGTITNYGIGFTRLGSTWDGGVWFNTIASSDYAVASLRPKLVVQSVSSLKTVEIDMRPYGQSNEINVKNNNGKVWVAVLSEIGFDAPNQINQTSLRFGHAGTETSFVSCKKDYNDVNKDNLPDLVCNFSTQLANFKAGDKIGKLTGKTINGVAINGEDAIRTVPAK